MHGPLHSRETGEYANFDTQTRTHTYVHTHTCSVIVRLLIYHLYVLLQTGSVVLRAELVECQLELFQHRDSPYTKSSVEVGFFFCPHILAACGYITASL